MPSKIPTQIPVAVHPEKDDPKVLGELILNSSTWICFRMDDKEKQLVLHKNTNDMGALILVAEFLICNRQERDAMLAYIRERTKFEIK